MACRCSSAPARSLHNVFVALPPSLRPATVFTRRSRSSLQPAPSRAAYLHTKSKVERVPTPLHDPEKPINDMIDAKYVQLVDSDNTISRVKLDHLLSRIDRAKEVVRQVAVDKTGPIVKIVSKGGLVEEAKVKELLAKTTQRGEKALKELEISWTIDRNNDLAYRSKKIASWLAEGRNVEITIAQKKGGRKPTPEECEELLATLRSIASEVKGARETSATGKMGRSFIIKFEGPDESAGTRQIQTIIDGRAEKKAQKQKEREQRKAEHDARAQRRAQRDEEYKLMKAQQS